MAVAVRAGSDGAASSSGLVDERGPVGRTRTVIPNRPWPVRSRCGLRTTWRPRRALSRRKRSISRPSSATPAKHWEGSISSLPRCAGWPVVKSGGSMARTRRLPRMNALQGWGQSGARLRGPSTRRGESPSGMVSSTRRVELTQRPPRQSMNRLVTTSRCPISPHGQPNDCTSVVLVSGRSRKTLPSRWLERCATGTWGNSASWLLRLTSRSASVGTSSSPDPRSCSNAWKRIWPSLRCDWIMQRSRATERSDIWELTVGPESGSAARCRC